jgi:hypothetical protein
MINSTAWTISGYSETNALIWASTKEEAIRLALLEAWFEYDEVTNLIAKREQIADGKRLNNYVICDSPTKSDTEILRDLGWHEIEGSCATCESCELYVWQDLPESLLTYDNKNDEMYEEGGICISCQTN